MSDLLIAPLVGSTVRPPQGDEGVATVIAGKRGFVEVDRYVAPEDENEVWLTLRRAGFEVSGA